MWAVLCNPHMLVLYGLLEIALGVWSWRFSTELHKYVETQARLETWKAGEVDGKAMVAVEFTFLVDGKQHKGGFVKQRNMPVEKHPLEELKDHYGLHDDGSGGSLLRVYYDPMNADNYALEIPNTWHAVLVIALGLYHLALLAWAIVNVFLFKYDQQDAIQKTRSGVPKVLKGLLVATGALAAVVAVVNSPFMREDVAAVLFAGKGVGPFSDMTLILIGVVMVEFSSAVIILDLPLFCGLAGVRRQSEQSVAAPIP